MPAAANGGGGGAPRGRTAAARRYSKLYSYISVAAFTEQPVKPARGEYGQERGKGAAEHNPVKSGFQASS